MKNMLRSVSVYTYIVNFKVCNRVPFPCYGLCRRMAAEWRLK